MKLAEKEICTGCGACREVCPKHAIEFREDDEGFPTPALNKQKCVECNQCERVCPALHMPKTQPVRAAYAAQIKDKTVLQESTSGGIFTALSREIFRQGGIVYGCTWDEMYNAIFRKAENEDELKPMRGSKYVWSYAGDVFSEVKKQLQGGRTVLFSGLPCQAAGLKNYLKEEYDNLYLLDFICSGVPSPLVLNKWLDTLCKREDRSELHLKFRDKEPYGVGVHITYQGQKRKPAQRGEHVRNSFYYSFYSHLIDRLCCYKCAYCTDQRVSDFTMGDYWGISNYHKEMDVTAGVSAFMVNSEKGEMLLESIKGTMELFPTKTEYISTKNSFIINGDKRNRVVPAIRNSFFNELKKNGWKRAEIRYLYRWDRIKKLTKVNMPGTVTKLLKRVMGGVKRA